MSLFFSFPLRLTFLLMLLLTACSQAATPTPSAVSQRPTFPAVVTFTPSAVPSPTATPTPSATPDRVATALARPTRTLHPTLTPSLTPTPYPTYPPAVWHPAVADQLITLPATEWAWSPVSNQLAYSNCPTPAGGLFLAQAPNFEPQDITPAGFICPLEFQFLVAPVWQPNEQSLIYTQAEYPDDPGSSASLWQLDLNSWETQPLNLVGWWQRVDGWLSDDLLVTSYYEGSMFWQIQVVNLLEKRAIAWASPRGQVEGLNPPWIATDFIDALGERYWAGGFSPTPIIHNPDTGYIEFLRYLGNEGRVEFDALVSSRFVSWLPQTPEMLIVTNPLTRTELVGTYLEEYSPVNDPDTGLPLSDLQLWNVETDELKLLVPGGWDGAFSPDRTYLTFIQQAETYYSWQLLNRVTGELIEVAQLPILIDLNTSTRPPSTYSFHFSPSGRYLSYYYVTVEPRQAVLAIYDLENGQMVHQLTQNNPSYGLKYLWSPAEDNLVYQQNDDWHLLFVPHNTTQTLTMKNGVRVGRPEWSFDGSYLAFDNGQDMIIWPVPATPPN